MPKLSDLDDYEVVDSKSLKLSDLDNYDVVDDVDRDIAVEPEYSKLESFGRGAAQGATLGFRDELAGALESPIGATKKLLSHLGVKYSDTDKDIEEYLAERDASRRLDELAREKNPLSFLGGEIGGGVATAVIPGVAATKLGSAALKAGNMPSRSIQAASQVSKALSPTSIPGMAALGTVSGAGLSEAETGKEFAGDMLKGGLIGGAAGGILKGVGTIPSALKTKYGEALKRIFNTDELVVTKDFSKKLNEEMNVEAKKVIDAIEQYTRNINKNINEKALESDQLINISQPTANVLKTLESLAQKAETRSDAIKAINILRDNLEVRPVKAADISPIPKLSGKPAKLSEETEVLENQIKKLEEEISLQNKAYSEFGVPKKMGYETIGETEGAQKFVESIVESPVLQQNPEKIIKIMRDVKNFTYGKKSQNLSQEVKDIMKELSEDYTEKLAKQIPGFRGDTKNLGKLIKFENLLTGSKGYKQMRDLGRIKDMTPDEIAQKFIAHATNLEKPKDQLGKIAQAAEKEVQKILEGLSPELQSIYSNFKNNTEKAAFLQNVVGGNVNSIYGGGINLINKAIATGVNLFGMGARKALAPFKGVSSATAKHIPITGSQAKSGVSELYKTSSRSVIRNILDRQGRTLQQLPTFKQIDLLAGQVKDPGLKQELQRIQELDSRDQAKEYNLLLQNSEKFRRAVAEAKNKMNK